MRRLPAILAARALVACAHHDPHADETGRQLAAIQQQLAEQQHELAEIRSVQATVPELHAVLDQLDALAQRIARVEAGKVAQRPAVRHEPDRAAVYAVPIDHDPVLGSTKAKVTLVMVMDFACPYCRKAWDTVDQLRAKYGADLRVAYKPFVVHPTVATHAAQAACAATRQGKFRELADLLWTKSFDVHDYADATVDGLAADAKLDLTRYHADIAGSCAQEIKDEMAQLTKLGIMATPTFFINGRYMSGAMPIEDFSTLVDEELAKATAAQKRGVKAERYYEQEIVGKGVKELVPAP
jgi:protein-disulfide isomerase